MLRYEGRLSELGLFRLERRQLESDVMLAQKITRGLKHLKLTF